MSPGIFEVTGKVKKLFLSFLLSGRSRRCVVVGKLPLLRRVGGGRVLRRRRRFVVRRFVAGAASSGLALFGLLLSFLLLLDLVVLPLDEGDQGVAAALKFHGRPRFNEPVESGTNRLMVSKLLVIVMVLCTDRGRWP